MTYRIFREKKERNTCKSKSQYVYRLYGCCMLVRNIYIKKVDFFDERTFLYCEEEILAEKFLKKNYKTYYLAESKIKHLESMTVGKKKGFNNLKKIFIVFRYKSKEKFSCCFNCCINLFFVFKLLP